MAGGSFDIQSATTAVSVEGMQAYIENLRLEILDRISEQINAVEDVETAIKDCWQGVSRDRFLENFASEREVIIQDLREEFNDLNARLEELQNNYFNQDNNMIM